MIKQLIATKTRLDVSDMEAGMKMEWLNVMKMHNDALVEIRARMEAVRLESEKPAPNLFTTANRTIEICKTDLKLLNAALVIFENNRSHGVRCLRLSKRMRSRASDRCSALSAI